ncbi:MAG: hypothetical protein V8T90_03715 [Victivallales bacterium]
MKVKWIFCVLTAALFLCAAEKPEDFQPDFKTWDIYLPHLNRTYLSGWWKLKKVSSDRRNDPLERRYEAEVSSPRNG